MSYEQEPMRVVGDRIISERQYQQEQRELAWLEFLHTQSAYDQLAEIDIEQELAAHKALSDYNEKRKKINELNTWIKRCELDEKRELKLVDQLKEEIAALENHTCHACGQAFHDENQETVLAKKRKELEEAALQALATNGQWIEHTNTLAELGELAWLEFLHTQSDKGDEDEYYQHCIENNIQYYTRAERVQRIKDLIARSEKEAQRAENIAFTIGPLLVLGVLALLVKGCTMLQ